MSSKKQTEVWNPQVVIGGVSDCVRDVIKNDIVKIVELWPIEQRTSKSLTATIELLKKIMEPEPIMVSDCVFNTNRDPFENRIGTKKEKRKSQRSKANEEGE